MSLKQHIEYALRDKIVDKIKHKQLIAEPYAISREYNVNPYFLFEHYSTHLSIQDVEFLKKFKIYNSNNPGIIFIDNTSKADSFQMMAAILIRNSMEAYYYRVEDFVSFLELDHMNKYKFVHKIVFIPNISHLENKQPFLNFLNFSIDNSIYLVLHFPTVQDIVGVLNEYWYYIFAKDFRFVTDSEN